MSLTPIFNKVDVSKFSNSTVDLQTINLTVTFDQTVLLRLGGIPLVSVIDYKNLSPVLGLKIISKSDTSFTYQFEASPSSNFFLEIFPDSVTSIEGVRGDSKPHQFNVSIPKEQGAAVKIQEVNQNYIEQYQTTNASKIFNNQLLTPENFNNQRFAKIEWVSDGNASTLTDNELKKLIDHIKLTGYTAVTFDAYMLVSENGKTIPSLANDSSYKKMFEAIDYAKSIGLNIGVHCYFNVGNNGQPITPSTIDNEFDIKSFFNSLEQFYKDVAPKLQSHSVSLFIIATEMGQFVTSQYHDKWSRIISTIKNDFKGVVTYDAVLAGVQANGDHSNYWFDNVGIWDLVDVIGIAFAGLLSGKPLTDSTSITKQFFSGSTSGDNFTSQLFKLSAKYQKKIFLDSILSWNSATEALLFNMDSSNNEIVEGKFLTDTLLQAKAFESILDWVNNNLYPIVNSYGIQGYHPWVYRNFGPLPEVSSANARKVIQTLAGSTTEFLGTLAESVISNYINSDPTFHINNKLIGGWGDDIFYTRNGENFIYLIGGSDLVMGGTGKDHIFADSNSHILTFSLNSWFSKYASDNNTITLLINNVAVESYNIKANPIQIVAHPDGYWSEIQSFSVDLTQFENVSSLKFITDSGLNELRSIKINILPLLPSPNNNINKDGAGNLKPYWVTGGSTSIFNLPEEYLQPKSQETIINGGLGIDECTFILSKYNYKLTKPDTNFLIKKLGGAESYLIYDTERLIFKDAYLAIDIYGNAGTTAKILGAVFGKESLSNKNYVGIGLHFLDAGWTYDNLAGLALEAAGAKTNDQIVSLLWTPEFDTK